MKKLMKYALTVVVFLSSVLFFGNKADIGASNKQQLASSKSQLILQHAKDLFSKADTASALAWHESHSSHWSHSSHESHYSHYSSSY